MVRHALVKDVAEAAAPVEALLKALAGSLSKFLTQRVAQLAAAVAEPPAASPSRSRSELTKEKLGATPAARGGSAGGVEVQWPMISPRKRPPWPSRYGTGTGPAPR